MMVSTHMPLARHDGKGCCNTTPIDPVSTHMPLARHDRYMLWMYSVMRLNARGRLKLKMFYDVFSDKIVLFGSEPYGIFCVTGGSPPWVKG